MCLCFYGYASTGDSGSWSVDIKMNIRPSSSTGVIFALVLNHSVPLSVAVVTQGEDEAVSRRLQSLDAEARKRGGVLNAAASMLQNLQVFLDGASVATLDSLMLCYPERLTVHLNVTPAAVHISANSSTITYAKSESLQEALERLNATMQNPVTTYIGGIPGQSNDRKAVWSNFARFYSNLNLADSLGQMTSHCPPPR